MKTTLITSTLAALGLAASLAAPALAARPDHFHAGDPSGVYLWHRAGVDHGWHLETTDPRQTGAHTYTGTITTDGHFTDVRLVRPEDDDSATVDGSGNLTFSFKTYSGIDGVDWRVDGGTQMTFTLTMDGQPLAADQINIGDNSRHPAGDPFTITV
jgi:hypothetical protein